MAEGGRWGPGPGQDQACRDLGYSRGVPAQAWHRGSSLDRTQRASKMAALPTVGLGVHGVDDAGVSSAPGPYPRGAVSPALNMI